MKSTKTTRNHTIRLLFTGIILAAATLACNAPGLQFGSASAPTATVQTSQEAYNSFNSKWRNLNLATPNGPFSITFSEAELTSAVNIGIAQQEDDSGTAAPIHNVQVVLRDGAIGIYGQVGSDALAVNGTLTVIPSIGADGLVHITITDVQFGPVQLDQSMLDEMRSRVEQSINEPIQASPFHIVLNAITIASGELTISGTITP